MKIGFVSDTHLPRFGKDLPAVLKQGLIAQRVALIHVNGTRKTTLERALDAFAGDAVDVILFGHRRSPYCKLHGDVWPINPGSPTDKRRNPAYSYAVLEIVTGRATPTLHYYRDKHVDH